jgi:hypothetical protein
MRRIEATRKQQIGLICLILLAIGCSFPTAMSGKTLGGLFWLGAAFLSLAMGITRLQVLAKPSLILMLLFAASFFIPVEVVVARGQTFYISWRPCKVMGQRSYNAHPIPLDGRTHVIVRGCCAPIGVEPSRVVKVCIPERK